jgi:hypothetical protein
MEDKFMFIILTEEDLCFIRDLAKKRNAKQAIFGTSTYGGKRRPAMAHFIGLGGEFAVAKSIGTQVDTRIFETHGDDGIDILEGKWGVKTTTYLTDPYLRVEVHHFNAEITGYVLCAYNPNIDLRKVEIVGWATRDDVLKANKKTLRRGGPLNYILYKKDLQEWVTTTYPCLE